jgi:NodT family efflux transporter outer membrane factor (OMF) lipoprotein
VDKHPQEFIRFPRTVSTRLRYILGLVTAVLVVSACTVGPDFVKPEAPVAEGWIEAANAKIKKEPAEHSDWWAVFDDPVLNTLVETAYQQNLPLQIAGIRILEARAQLGIAVGNLYPQLQQASGAATANELSDNAPNVAVANKFFYDYAIAFDTAWELDFWGRFRRGMESADADLIASIANYDDVLVSLTAEVARSYILIRTFEERVKLALENVGIQERSLEIADVRFRNGLVTELDVQQARSLLRDTQALIPRLEIGLRQTTNALSILLGIPPRDLAEVLGEPSDIPTAPAEVVVGIPADLLRRRPDIRRAELEAAAQSARIGIAKSDLYPRFSLIGSIGLQSSDNGGLPSNNANFSDLFDTDSLTYFVGPSFEWPILNYGRLTNNVRVQDARFQRFVVNYQNTVLEAAREVEDGLVGFLRTQDQVQFLTDSVEAAERSVDLALIQYRDGTVDYQRVLDTQESLVQEQDLLATARGDVGLNLVATYKALGGGWQIRKDKAFVPAETKETMRKRTNWGDLLSPKDLPESLDPPPPAGEEPLFQKPDW